MMNLKKWWKGPEGEYAWQYSSMSPGVHIRTWPVKFKNTEELDTVFQGLRDTRLVQKAQDQWSLQAPDQSGAVGAARAQVRHTITVNGDQQSSATDIQTLFAGRSHMRTTFLHMGFDVLGASNTIGYWISFQGRAPKNPEHRGNVEYIRVQRQGIEHVDGDFPYNLPQIEELIEKHTIPMTRWERFWNRPVASPFTERELMEQSSSRKKHWWTVATVVIALPGAVAGLAQFF